MNSRSGLYRMSFPLKMICGAAIFAFSDELGKARRQKIPQVKEIFTPLLMKIGCPFFLWGVIWEVEVKSFKADLNECWELACWGEYYGCKEYERSEI